MSTFFFFSLFVFLLFSLLPLILLSHFPQILVLRLADRRIVLPRDVKSTTHSFFVNSFPNQMLVHHILVIKQITSGAAEHRHKLCLVPNMRQTEMTLVLLETVSAKPKPTNCVALSLTFQALK